MELNQDIFLSTIDELSEAIVIYDKDDNFVACNRANHELYPHLSPLYKKGNTLKDILRLAYTQGQWKSEFGNEDEFVESRTREHWLPFHETEQHLADGRWLLVRNKRLENGLFIGMRTDITEMKRREEELLEAQNRAEAADRAKSEFLANMSHEIRTPMNGVMGMAELLASTDLDSKQAMFTDVIVKSGSSLLTIINDILDFSKIDAGQMELDPAPFQLAEAIEDVATLVSSKVAEKDLELIVRVDPQLPKMIVGDAGRVRQIITNLMGNAVKFTEQGHVYVNVEGSAFEEGEDRYTKLKFSVEDTGVGIPADQCETVFQKFSQVDTSATRKHEGTGLGLSISSSLVNLMGGEIGVDSIVGQGSTFWFEATFPVHDDIVSERIIPGDLSGSRVLIIDDNAVNRAILTEQMNAWKFDNAAACSGAEGLEVMRAAAANGIKLDLVVLDYQMPEMDGAQVLRAMRSEPELSEIPVVMLTSVDSSEINLELNRLGAEANLTKPARSSLLLETMLQVIANCQANLEVRNTERPETTEKPLQSNNTDERKIEKRALEILVAEDNQVNQIVFQQVLEDCDRHFRIVDNGRLALAAFKIQAPKLILMDVSMPEMNGKEATIAIRKYEQENGLDRTPIIGVTAHALKGDMESCIDAGMDDYLSKPVSPNKLKRKIEQWLKLDLENAAAG